MSAIIQAAVSLSDYNYKRGRIDSFWTIIAVGLAGKGLIGLFRLARFSNKNHDHINRTRVSMLNGLFFSLGEPFFLGKKGSVSHHYFTE